MEDNKYNRITADEFVYLTSLFAKICDKARYPFTPNELLKIICNRYHLEYVPNQMPDLLGSDYDDLKGFLHALNDKNLVVTYIEPRQKY